MREGNMKGEQCKLLKALLSFIIIYARFSEIIDKILLKKRKNNNKKDPLIFILKRTVKLNSRMREKRQNKMLKAKQHKIC